MSFVLVVDKSGMPKQWATYETAAIYYAKNKVIWEIGNELKEFVGGISAKTGIRSKIRISSILGIHGPILGDEFYDKEQVHGIDRQILYFRDKRICAYCGQQFLTKNLTADHILPRSRGGLNTWVNCVTACQTCNHKKADRTPEEARMQLIYVPYTPSRYEKMILRNRNILEDQMEFLLARVPKTSRLFS